MAYRYCYNALRSAGTEEAAAAAARVQLDVNTYLQYDLKMYDRFFQTHRDNNAASIADMANDGYIKASGDKNGTASYGQVSIYLVNWYIEKQVRPFEGDDSGFDPLDKDFVHGALGE